MGSVLSIVEKLKTAGFGESKIDPIAMAPIIDKALAMAQMKDPAGEIRKLTTKMNEEKTRLEGEVANRDALVKKQLEDLGRRRHPARTRGRAGSPGNGLAIAFLRTAMA